MIIRMDNMTFKPTSRKRRTTGRGRKDNVYLFFFGRTDLLSFGIQCLGCGRADRDFRMRQLIENRTLLHYVCVFIAEGEGFFESAHQARTKVHENQAMLLIPEERHSYGCNPKGDWTEYWIVFDGQAIRQAHQNGVLSVERPLLEPENPQTVKALFRALIQVAQSSSQRRQKGLPGQVHQLLDELLPSRAPSLSSAAANAVAGVQQILLGDPASDIDFRELACRHGVSYSLLRQRFRQAYGVSLVGYRTQCRMNLACSLLAGGHSVKETASLVGIDDPYYFSRTFHQIIGTSPNTFTKRLQP